MKFTITKKFGVLLLLVTVLSGCSSNEAKEFYKSGLNKFDNGNYEEALEDFKKTLELNDNRAEYHREYATTLAILGETEEALKVFDNVIMENDNNVARKNNKLAYRGKGIAYYLDHDYSNAVVMFEKALEISTYEEVNEDIYRYIASAKSKAGLYEEALASYNELLKLNTEDSTIYNDRSFVYSKLGQYENAVADIGKAIDLKPHEYEYYIGKYFLEIEMGDTAAASETLKIAENLDIKTEEDKYNIARVHYYMKEYDIAKIEFSEAARNGFTKAYYYLGNIYNSKEDYENALLNYNLYIENEGSEKNATVYNQLGVIYINLKQYDKAVEVLSTGIEINNKSIESVIRKNYITALEGVGDYNTAYKEIKEYLKSYPKDKDLTRELDFIKTRVNK